MHTYIHTHTYIHAYMHTCIHACIHTYIHINLVVQVAADADDVFNKADMLGEGPVRDEARPRSNSNHILLSR